MRQVFLLPRLYRAKTGEEAVCARQKMNQCMIQKKDSGVSIEFRAFRLLCMAMIKTACRPTGPGILLIFI